MMPSVKMLSKVPQSSTLKLEGWGGRGVSLESSVDGLTYR